MILNENMELYKGVFWIVDTDNIYKNRKYCFKIPSDTDGNPLDIYLDLNAKKGNTYNHKLLWNKLLKNLTHGKPYNYYPRGRVEIQNGKAKIFLNGNINTTEVLDFLIDEFNLNNHNGIKKINIIEDNSNHYLCYLDDGWKAD